MHDVQQLQQLNIKNLAYDTTYFANHIKGMQVYQTAGYVVVNSTLPTFNFNIITLLQSLHDATEEHLLDKIKAFNKRGLPFNLWCYEHDQQTIDRLKAIGLQKYDTTYLAMVAHLSTIKQVPISQGNLSIRKVSTADELFEFASVLMSLYNDILEKEAIQQYYEQVTELPKSTIMGTDLYIGMLQDKVVSIGALTKKENTIGMYHIATLKAYRGQGLATQMVIFLLNKAKKSGATYATLQSSPEGKGIYERFGFIPVGVLKVFENKHLFKT